MLLFIDDEPRRLEAYRQELVESGYEVTFSADVENAWTCFETNMSQIDLVILDIMMAPGSIGNTETPGAGSRTGVKLFEMIRGAAPQMPVFVFTNVSDPSVAQRFEKEKLCRFFRKVSLLPHELAEEVGNLVSTTRRRNRQ